MSTTLDAPTRVPDRTDSARPVIAFGPRLPGIGSWEWVGADLVQALAADFETVAFEGAFVPCDLIVLVKPPDRRILARIPPDVPLIYCPIDRYGSAAEIDRDWRLLRRSAVIVTHAELLRKYFAPYARVESVDHHLKYTAPLRDRYLSTGPILWVGLRSNLPPLVEWINHHGLPETLVVLTNLQEHEPPEPRRFGFRANGHVRIERWSASRHRELTAQARAAIDVKGDDFRQRHKPPTKALDFLASGVPLALNAGSSPDRYLRRHGFPPATPDDPRRWLSRAYWDETRAFGRRLREELTLERVTGWFRALITDVLQQQRTPACH